MDRLQNGLHGKCFYSSPNCTNLNAESPGHMNLLLLTRSQFFAEYPNFRETVDHKQMMLGLVSAHKHQLSPQTFPVLLNVLPHALYIVDNDFSAIGNSYIITHVSHYDPNIFLIYCGMSDRWESQLGYDMQRS
jgi:hypothetical protein